VNSGGSQVVSSGGVASAATINSGGSQSIVSGGTANQTTVGSGGSQLVLAGGVSNDAMVNSGGYQYIDGVVEGYAYNATVNSGGVQEVATGGTAQGTLVAGGTQQVDSGGLATSTTVNNGGVQDILAGGSATGTTVSSGTVIVDGTASNLTVGSGAVVTGTGTVMPGLTMTSGSTLVQNTLGAGLHVSGTLSLESGSTYNVTLSPGGTSGTAAVTGNLTIGSGAALTLTSLSGTYSVGTTYTVLTYTGLQTGAFGTVTSNFAYLTPGVAYSSGVVTVTLNAPSTTGTSGTTTTTGSGTTATTTTTTNGSGNTFSFALAGDSLNQNNVASALTANYGKGGSAVTNALLVTTVAQAYSALDELSGVDAVPFRQIAEARTGQAQDTVAQHLASLDPATQHGLWVSAAYQQTSVDGDAALGSSPYDDHSTAVTLGYDQRLTQTVRAGAALMFNNDNVDFSSDGASARTDGVQAELYGSWTPAGSPLYATGIAGLGYWNNRLSRQVSVGAVSNQDSSTFNTSSLALYGEAGLKLAFAVGTVQPYAALSTGHYAQQGATEGGGVTALTYASANTNALSSILGARFLKQGMWLFGHALDLQADISWEHRLTGADQSLTAALADAPQESWQVFGTPSDRNAAKLQIGADWQVASRTKVFARLGAEYGTNTHDYGGELGAQWKW
jgi:autotransporter passenger strand-loop-strand repeat protein